MCPKNVKDSHLCFLPRTTPKVGSECPPQLTTVELNGRALKALIDTGSKQTLVQQKYIPGFVSSIDKRPIRCIHGDERLCSTAAVYIKVKYIKLTSWRWV